MGIRVCSVLHGSDRIYPGARDWYVTEEGVLQIYQEHELNLEFVIAEYNNNAWEIVTWDPPVPLPQPKKDPGATDEAERDENNPDLKDFK